jgi:hypothetical protein
VKSYDANNHRRSWREVNAASPCPACKHGSWCRVTDDGALCACRRGGDGTGIKKGDKNGEDYWLVRLNGTGNGEQWEEPRFHHADRNGERAPPEILDQVYRKLIEQLPLSMAHRNDLDRRGLQTGFKARGYFTLGKGRTKAAYALARAGLEEHLPGVPGFFVQEKDGRRYWSIGGWGGLAIPIRNVQGQIIAIQTRSDGAAEGGKYKYLSTKGHGGSGSGAPIHVPLFAGDGTTVRVTEGALKADIATDRSGMLTVGLPGVSAWRRAAPVLRELGAKTARLAYDADACHNRTVAESLSNLARHLRHRGFAVELKLWDEADGKGIDDLLAAGKTPDVVTGDEAIDSVLKRIVADARKADPRRPKAVRRADRSSTGSTSPTWATPSVWPADTAPICVTVTLGGAGCTGADDAGRKTRPAPSTHARSTRCVAFTSRQQTARTTRCGPRWGSMPGTRRRPSPFAP